MNFRLAAAGALALVTALITGCASTPLVPVTWSKPAANAATPVRVGVVMTAVPTPDMAYPGAGCLLCMGAAAIANSGVSTMAGKLSTEDLGKLKGEMTALLRKQGYDAVTIVDTLNVDDLPKSSGTAPNTAVKDFTALKDRFHVEKIAVVQITRVGFDRNYAAYVPTSPPMAVVHGVGYVVDLKTNTYDWYASVDVMKGAEGEWSEPPAFPGLTNAYFQAVETARDQFKAPFSK